MKVLLVHGLGRTPLSMAPLIQPLRQSGHEPELFGYAAFAESYERIVERLHLRFLDFARQGDYGVVAHSLGGLLTRSAVGLGGFQTPKQVIMLGTPNKSPRMARLAWKWLPPFQWFAGSCGRNLANEDWYETLPPPNFPFITIAGTRGWKGSWSPFGGQVNDGLVALDEVALDEMPSESGDLPIQVPSFHTFMMVHPDVQTAIVDSLNQA